MVAPRLPGTNIPDFNAMLQGKTVPEPLVLRIASEDRRPAVDLYWDGGVRYYEPYHPGLMAQAFWRTLAGANPASAIVGRLSEVLQLIEDARDSEGYDTQAVDEALLLLGAGPLAPKEEETVAEQEVVSEPA